MGIKKELGQKIKRMRLNRNLTQEELAEKVDITQRALSGIETGENFVTAETLDKLIVALDTTPEDIFSTSHIKSPSELRTLIIQQIDKIGANQQLLELVYNVVLSITKE